jgi:TRAP-type C4-dicarboxylate transport system permease small subunit
VLLLEGPATNVVKQVRWGFVMGRTSLLRALFRVVQTIEEWILSLGIILIAVVTIVNVICRTVLNASLTFAEELSQFFIILVTFIGLGYAASKGRHIRMSALYDQLGRRARKFLMLVIASTTSALMFLLAYYSIRYIATVASLGSVSPALQVPIYIVYCAVPAGLFIAGVQYALTVARNLSETEVFLSYEEKDEYRE